MQETEETRVQFLHQEDSLEEEITQPTLVLLPEKFHGQRPSGSMGAAIQTQLSTHTHTLELIHFIVLAINSLNSPLFFLFLLITISKASIRIFVCKNRIWSHMKKLSF